MLYFSLKVKEGAAAARDLAKRCRAQAAKQVGESFPLWNSLLGCVSPMAGEMSGRVVRSIPASRAICKDFFTKSLILTFVDFFNLGCRIAFSEPRT
jgi:hypothetical protein